MKRRFIVLAAAAALLMVGAVPVSAAPGGVPGPPPGHGKSGDDVVIDSDDDVTEEDSKIPDWAKAYGKRIKDEYGVPFGHLQQCAGVADGDDLPEGDDALADGDEPKKALEACPEDLVFPEDESGAKAFYVFTQVGALIVGT